MERAKLAKESKRELLVGRSRFSAEQNVAVAPSSAGKKAVRKKAPQERSPAQPLRKKKEPAAAADARQHQYYENPIAC